MENEKKQDIIKTKDLTFDYIRHDEEGNEEGAIRAVDGVNLEVKPGDFIAILGHNGSGKSTLAKHINALLVPTSGTIGWMERSLRRKAIYGISARRREWCSRIPIIRSSDRWWKRMLASDRKTWGFPQRKYGNGWRKA